MPTVTRLTSNGVFQSSGGFDEISLDSGSINFNGTNQYLTTPSSSRFSLTGDFTVESWMWIDSTVVSSRPDNLKYVSVFSGFGSTGGTGIFEIAGSASSAGTGLVVYQDVPSISLSAPVSIPLNSWVHIAFVRIGTTIYGFVNGQRITLGTSSAILISASGSVAVGRHQNTSYFSYMKGYISNHRVVNGTAVYIDNFIPPTAPLTPVANTVLLLTASPQSPFSDSSNNNFTITKVSNPQFNTLGPFYYPGNTSINLANTNNNPVLGSNTNIITSTTSNGVVMVTGEFDEVSMSSQSLLFNGTTGYLSVPTNSAFSFGTGNFTVEFWFNASSYKSFGVLFSTTAAYTTSNNFYIQTNVAGSTFLVTSAGVLLIAAPNTFNLNTWYHIAVVRNATTMTLYVDGVSQGSVSNSQNFVSDTPVIGSVNTTSYPVHGFISNLRVVKGTAVYTANSTPPQMALTAVANTVLLLNNFTAQPFVDNSGNNNTITVNGGVTANTLTPFANTQRKILNTGTMMVKQFDEFTWNPPIVTNGLVLNLDAANPNSYSGSGTIWTDLSGNGNNGTLTNGPTYNSIDGGSIVFDGTDDFVQCSGSLTVTAATFVTWIRRNGDQGQYDGILFSRGSSVTGMNFQVSNQIGYTWNDAGNTYGWQSGLTIPDLTWCMVAVSVTSTAATAYLCQTSGITTATNTVNHASSLINDIKIARDEFSTRYFTGNIAIAQLYNIALSADQISQNFAADRGRFGV